MVKFKNLSRVAPTDAHVGQRVRAARLSLRVSQKDLGEALGVSFQQIQKYEKGTNRIGSSRLQAIATRLDKPIGWFFEGAPGGAMPPHAAAGRDLGGELLATPGGAELARHFTAIDNATDRKLLVDMAGSLASIAGARAAAAGAP